MYWELAAPAVAAAGDELASGPVGGVSVAAGVDVGCCHGVKPHVA
jgi:hypothetical protein